MLLTLLSSQSEAPPIVSTPRGGYTEAQWQWYLGQIKRLQEAVAEKNTKQAEIIVEQIETAPIELIEIEDKRAELIGNQSVDYLSLAEKMAQNLSSQIADVEAVIYKLQQERMLKFKRDEEEALLLLM